ncbi:MAG: hypothetical protein LIQ31_11055 [Planctomycetes bacterium]|nr:hypothetical protein [Planctomycetota bacterium]
MSKDDDTTVIEQLLDKYVFLKPLKSNVEDGHEHSFSLTFSSHVLALILAIKSLGDTVIHMSSSGWEKIMKKNEFKSKINLSIDHKATEIVAQKQEDKYLTYIDAKAINIFVGSIFMSKLNKIPPQVEAAMLLAEATISPSATERIRLLKSAAGVAGGAAGIALVVTGVLTAIGAGTGVITAVTVFFTGSSLLGPVGMIAGGVALATIAGYFAFSGNPQENSEAFLKALKSGLGNAIDTIWQEYGNKLSYEEDRPARVEVDVSFHDRFAEQNTQN